MKKFSILWVLVMMFHQGIVAQCPAPLIPPADQVNVISNPGFETGSIAPSNAGLHAQTFIPQSSPGTFQVGPNTSNFNTGMISVSAHSGNNMLMIDGILLANATAWEQTVTVQTNRTYYFSAWLTALSAVEKSQMVFQVIPQAPVASGAVNISNSFIPPNGPEWKQEFGTWFSGSTTSVTIRLVNTNPLAVGGAGNDYAIDDLLFRPTCDGVDAGPKPNFGATTLGLCNVGGSADLNPNVPANPNHTFTWFKDDVLVANVTTPNILESQNQAGVYTVCLDSAGCVQSAEVTLVTTLSLDLGSDANLCNPAFALLDTRITNASSFTIEWYRDNVLIAGQTLPTYTATGPGSYRVEVSDGGSCNGTDEVIVTSQVDETVGAVICPVQGETSITVSVVDNGGNYSWYDAEVGGNLLGTGLTYSSTGLTGPVNYYVENSNPATSTAGLLNQTSTVLTTSSSSPNNVHDQNLMNFTANKDATIDFIDVYLEFSGNFSGNLTIRLDDVSSPNSPGSPLILNSTFAINHTSGAGNFMITVPVNRSIVNGRNYRISITGINGQFFTRRYADGGISAYFPSISEAVTLTGGQAPSIYPGMFNWQLSHPSSCARTPAVVAVSDACLLPSCSPDFNAIISPVEDLLVSSKDIATVVLSGAPSVFNEGSSPFPRRYFWSINAPDTIAIISNQQDASISFSIGGIGANYPEGGYTFYLITMQGGCIDTASVEFNVANFFIPNLITSNGDNINDKFEITSLEGRFNLEVFNRWGSLIYKESGYTKNWDPRDVSDGIYYYYLEDTATSEKYKGWVQVIH